MTAITFSGASDDTVIVTVGADAVLEFKIDDNEAATFLVIEPVNHEALIVEARFDITGWCVGAAPAEDGVAFPEWDMLMGRSERSFSPILTINAPEGTAVTHVGY